MLNVKHQQSVIDKQCYYHEVEQKSDEKWFAIWREN